MKKRYYIYLIISVLTVVLGRPASAFAQNDGATVSLSRDSILTGDQVVLNLGFKVADRQRFAIAPYKAVLEQDTTLKGGVEVVKDFTIDTAALKSGVNELKARAILTSFDSGSFKLPTPLIVLEGKGGKADTLRFKKDIVLSVSPIQIDTTSFKLYDIKGQEKYPVTFKDILPWLILLIVLTLITLAVMRYIKMRREQKNFFGKSIIKEPPHIVALKKLEKIRSEKLYKHGKEKAYYTAITDAVREYIEKRYAFGAVEKTSAEIMEELSTKEVQKELFEKLEGMFKTADLVKFAKFIPAEDENEGAVLTAVNFVNFAYMQFLSEQEAAASATASASANKKEGK